MAFASARMRRLLAVFALNGIASALPATLFLFFVADVLRAEAASGRSAGTLFRDRRPYAAALGVRRTTLWQAPGVAGLDGAGRRRIRVGLLARAG